MSDTSPAAGSTPPRRELGLREAFGVLRRRWWLILVGLIGVPLAVLVYCQVATPKYTATAVLQMEPNDISALGLTTEILAATRQDIFARAQFYSTERELIRSEKNLSLVLADDALWSRCGVAGDDPVHALAERVEVEGAPQSKLSEIKVTHEDPQCAADLANAVTQTYVDENLTAARAKFTTDVEHVQPVIERLREELDQNLADTEAFKREKGIVAPLDAPVADDQKRLADLRAQLDQARVRRVGIQKRYETATATLGRASDVQSLPETIADPVVSRLRASYLTLLAEYADLSQRYRPKHPNMQRVQAQLDELEASIAAEMERVVDTLEVEYTVALEAERSLDGFVSSLEEAILAKSAQTAQAGVLADQTRSRRQLVDSLVDKITEASIAAAIKQNNVEIIDLAKPPLAPSYPSTPLFLAIGLGAGLVLGLTLAFLAEALDSRVRTPEDLELVPGLPFAAAVPWARLNGAGPPPPEAFERAVVWLESERSTEGARAGGCQIVTVAGLEGGEGACTAVAGIAVGEARAGRRVLVVDARPDTTGPARLLGGSAEQAGLSEWVSGRSSKEGVLQRATTPNVDLVTAGGDKSGAHLLRHDRVAEAFDSVAASYDLILIDAPPLKRSALTQVLARNSDLLLVIVAANRTRQEDLASVVRELAATGPVKARALLNGVRA